MKNARRQFVKDLMTAVGGFCIMWILCSVSGSVTSVDLVGCFMCAGCLFGWRIAGSIITATSLYGVLIKLLLAVMIGVFALPFILVKDIIRLISESRKASADTN